LNIFRRFQASRLMLAEEISDRIRRDAEYFIPATVAPAETEALRQRAEYAIAELQARGRYLKILKKPPEPVRGPVHSER